jgi:hypothetical protein
VGSLLKVMSKFFRNRFMPVSKLCSFEHPVDRGQTTQGSTRSRMSSCRSGMHVEDLGKTKQCLSGPVPAVRHSQMR